MGREGLDQPERDCQEEKVEEEWNIYWQEDAKRWKRDKRTDEPIKTKTNK